LTLGLAAPLANGETVGGRFLTTHGTEIHDGKGAVVMLRGVNLGSWLVFEPWMSPMDASGIKDDHAARATLARRFGEPAADSLLRTYQENWITAKDLDHIAALGMNLIRIPFWYRNLQTEEGVWLPGGLNRLDWVVAEAWKRGIYSILDLHGAPGGQTKGVSAGRQRERAELWDNEPNLRRTAAIWRKTAEHFRGNPAVAAYDLLNEPFGAPSLGTLWCVYDRLYREIRQVDPDHIITIEGCISTRVGNQNINWGWDALPHPDLFGWKNVLYQFHSYEWDWNNLEKQKRNIDGQVSDWRKHKADGVPVFIGEFNPMGHEEAWNYAFQQFNEAGMHWAFWNYKATHGTGSDSWGLFNPLKKDAPNLLTDDAATIRAKWQATDTGASYALNPMLDRALKAALKPPVATASKSPAVSANP
jgi:aryl-phospho-beta-D-glucosidase BglC (GH1 family)